MMMCSTHAIPCIWKEGKSKTTGKDFAFWACPEKDDQGNYCKAEKYDDEGADPSPAKELAGQARYQAAATPAYREKVEQPNWEQISRGKVRHGVAVAYIRSGEKSPTSKTISEMEQWVDYIMDGPPPEQE